MLPVRDAGGMEIDPKHQPRPRPYNHMGLICSSHMLWPQGLDPPQACSAYVRPAQCVIPPRGL